MNLWKTLTHGRQRFFHRQDWPEFGGDADARRILDMDLAGHSLSKQGRNTGLWVFRGAKKTVPVYLKRHHVHPWWQRLLASFFPRIGCSHGMAEWRHLRRVQKLGVPVADPVAAGEVIGPWFALKSFLAIEELTGMDPLHRLIPRMSKELPPSAFARWKRGLARELARVVRLLHAHKCYHRDLYLAHFFMSHADIQAQGTWGPPDFCGRLFLIDFHRMSHHLLSRPRLRVKDLAQLLFSSAIEGVDDRDRLRFFRHYVGQGKRSWRKRLLLRFILAKAKKIDRHYAKHKKHFTVLARERDAHEPETKEVNTGSELCQ